MLPTHLTPGHGLLLALLLVGFWIVDVLLGREWLVGLLRSLRLRSRALQIPMVFVPSAAAAVFWTWSAVPGGATLRIFALVLVGMLTWKTVTEDVDLGTGEWRWGSRLLLLLATSGLYFSPAFLIPALFFYTSVFDAWRHHATLPLRLVESTLAFAMVTPLLAALVGPVAGLGVFVFFVLVVQISHYLITAFAKGMLGPKWYSWIKDNRLHHLAASAYSWGWARFVPPRFYLRFVGLLRVAEKPFQALAFGLEALVPLALLDPRIAIALCVGLMLFQVVVFLSSGILFWEWVVANGLLIFLIASLPEPVAATIFGWHALVVGLAIMLLFPLRGRLWKPMPLGWWDTPFTQRVLWRVRGESGRLYGVYNNLMDPHERLYGRIHGAFLVQTPMFTYHLGEVWKRELRDALRDSQGDPRAIGRIRERFGIVVHHPAMAEQHARYLRVFFQRLNQRRRKALLPRWLAWLKAPGGQFYYWGDLPAYRGQEPVTEVQILYREEFFDGSEYRTVREERLLEIPVDGEPAEAPVRDVHERDLEAMILARADGRLIDLPASWKEGLVGQAEDEGLGDPSLLDDPLGRRA